MADEAFALSPISARAALPREEDYDAIREAFMETSRGRWFLGEYAKRNRNADTGMVLDAVARIEASLAAQKQPATADGLAEALAAIANAVDEARAAAVTALGGLAQEETLAPVHKGIRVIKEISWRWREIGADGRICDLIDSQVSAIEASYEQLASAAPDAAVSAAFDLLKARIAEFGETDAAMTDAAMPPEATGQAARQPSPARSDETPAATVKAAPDDAEAASSTSAFPAEADVAADETADVAIEAAGATTAADEAHDDAVLDMIALEMGDDEPYPDEPSEAETTEPEVAELAPAGPIIVAEQPEPVAALPPPPTPEPSLGSSLIANGIVRRPHTSSSDPLAPIRRMSQAEKIALFS
jgi:hypothetical protein